MQKVLLVVQAGTLADGAAAGSSALSHLVRGKVAALEDLALAIKCSGLEVTPAILLPTHWPELVTWLCSTARGWDNSTTCSKGRHPEILGKRDKGPIF